MSTSFILDAYSFRTLPTPLEEQGIHRYYCVVPVKTIPEEFLNWMDVNAREPSLNGRVPREIRTTLREIPENFIAYNRGLAILANSVEYDNKFKKVKLTFGNKKNNGVFDGGHTLNVIIDERNGDSSNSDSESSEEAYCQIEIITGLPEDIITQIVDARNTSKQVASKSLLNLEGKFSNLKKSLGTKVTELIAWKENEEAPIDVREVIALLTMFDLVIYDDVKHPLKAYSGKEACLNDFKNQTANYEKIYSIAKDILKLNEQIQACIPQQYNIDQGGKFGKLKGCKLLKKPRKLPITGESINYEIPNAYTYPILAAFRSMVTEVDGVYQWNKGIDPSKLVKDGLANKIFIGSLINSIKQFHNPNRTGKDANVWGYAYQIAENYFLKI